MPASYEFNGTVFATRDAALSCCIRSFYRGETPIAIIQSISAVREHFADDPIGYYKERGLEIPYYASHISFSRALRAVYDDHEGRARSQYRRQMRARDENWNENRYETPNWY